MKVLPACVSSVLLCLKKTLVSKCTFYFNAHMRYYALYGISQNVVRNK